MYAIDAFCDQDTIASTINVQQLPKDFDTRMTNSLDIITQMINSFEIKFDGIILGSGFELINLDHLVYPILSSDLRQRRVVHDKLILSMELKKLNLLHPHVYNNLEEIKFPVITKPRFKGGGVFNKIANNKNELTLNIEEYFKNQIVQYDKDIIIQEYIEGIPVSVSLIATSDKVVSIAVNEQLIGEKWLTNLPYAYCGNITPYEGNYAKTMISTANKLIEKMKLKGSIGVDFIVNETGAYVLEINPRFQGSLDTVEMSTGLNLFDAHVKSFDGIIPSQCGIKQYSGRCILYADKKIMITEELLNKLEQYMITDIPKKHCIIKKNEPIISLLFAGNNRQDIINNLKHKTREIKSLL